MDDWELASDWFDATGGGDWYSDSADFSPEDILYYSNWLDDPDNLDFLTDSSIFDLAFDPSVPWQVNGVDVNNDWNPFNNWTEGEDYNLESYLDGSDWINTGIFAPLYESGVGQNGPSSGSDYAALMSKLLPQLAGSTSKSPLSKIQKEVQSAIGTAKDFSNSPIGGILSLIRTMLARNKASDNARKIYSDSRNIVTGKSQLGRAPNRRDINMDGSQRDPMSYVAKAPLIDRSKVS